MSPEQAAGQSVLDHRTDIYSLGVTLYELLTRRPVCHQSDQRTALNGVIQDEPLSPRKIDHSIPPDLETIVLKAIRKSADERYRSARELADDLRRFKRHEPIVARRTSQFTRLCRWTRRNPLLAISTGIISILLATIAIGGVATSIHLVRLNRLAGQELYVADIAKAKLAIERGNHLAAERLLHAYAGLDGDDDPRGFEWYYLWKLCHQGGPNLILSHGLNVFSVAYSPDDRLVATAGFNGRIYLWNSSTGKPVRKIDGHHGHVKSLQFSADGLKLLSGGRDCRACIWEVDSGNLLWSVDVPARPNHEITDAAFSPDEKLVAIGHSRTFTSFPTTEAGIVSVWDIENNRKIVEKPDLSGRVKLAFSPTEPLLAAVSLDGKLRVWDTECWALIHSAQTNSSGSYSIAFAPDGNSLAVGGGRWLGKPSPGEVTLLSTHTWKPLNECRCGSGHAQSLAFSPDGRTLAVGFYDRMVSLIDLQSNEVVGELPAHTGAVADLAFSSDGQFLLSGSSDNSARLWHRHRMMRETRGPLRAHGFINDVRFLDDDRLCAVDMGTAYIIDTETGEIEKNDARRGIYVERR